MILQPYLNPIKYTKLLPDEVPQYISKHMDEWPFPDTIKPWEQPTTWTQPWQFTDSIRQQFQSNIAPIRQRLYSRDGAILYDDNWAQMQQSMNMEDMYIYQSDMALNLLSIPGCYYIRLDIGSPAAVTLISDMLYVAGVVENTLLLGYSNDKFYGDVVFENGYSPTLRIYGRLKLKPPQARDTVYEDQRLNMTIIDSKPYRIWELQLSSAAGIPPYFIDKLNWILGCSDLTIDGRYYTKSEGSKLEEIAISNYPMSGWSIDLREKLNRSSIIYEDEAVVNGTISVVANTDSKGFGQDDSGGSVFQILDVN